MKPLSRADIAAMLLRARFGLTTARDDCAERASDVQREKSSACDARRADVGAAKERRGAAYREARGSFGRAKRACAPSVDAAKATAPKGKKRDAAKAARESCRSSARVEEAQKFGRYYRARREHETATAERRSTCDAAKGARGRAFGECMAPAMEKHSQERRAAEIAESERRQSAKLARGGKRPPVSPAERQQEEIARARADLEAYDDGARAVFDGNPNWFFRQWSAATKRGRKISLAEWTAHYAEENPDLVTEAQQENADRWAEEQMRTMFRDWQRAAA